jgi:hypothetical protein
MRCRSGPLQGHNTVTRSAAEKTDVAEKQNERPLGGNTQILKHIEALEEQILKLEERIMAELKAAG